MLSVGSSRYDMRVAATARIGAPPVRRVTLVVHPSSARAVHGEIARRLSRAGVSVSLSQAGQAPDLPSSVELLLRLERMVLRAPGTLGERRAMAALALPPAQETADLTIDFSGNAVTKGRALRVLYDGVAGESAMMGALFAGQMPSIELQDATSGEIVNCVCPGADNGETVAAALEAVLAGLVSLIVNTVRGWGTRIEKPASVARSPDFRSLAALKIKVLAHASLRRLYHLCCHAPHWRVCWRNIDGPDLWDTRTLAATAWQVVPDPGTHFYADPFPVIHRGRTWVFVEDLDHRTNKGVISVIPFGERGPSGPARVVLEEPWHLSYPFVFERDGQMWMIPESSRNETVTLYRAERFPDLWVKEADLLPGTVVSDATIVDHAGRMWMFATTRDELGSWSDTLSIFHATNLLGPWQPHDGNPVLVDQSSARPAGAFVHRHGRLWRPVQDCRRGYGTGIGLAEVTRLDTEVYEQVLHTVLYAPPDWPGPRIHTINRAGSLECIDGTAHSPRSRLLAERLQRWSGRRELAQ